MAITFIIFPEVQVDQPAVQKSAYIYQFVLSLRDFGSDHVFIENLLQKLEYKSLEVVHIDRQSDFDKLGIS